MALAGVFIAYTAMKYVVQLASKVFCENLPHRG